MDHMTGAIEILLPKLGELLKQEHNLQPITTPIKKHIKSLDRQLRIMEDALVRMPRAHNWSYRLRELSYDIEDIVDCLMLHIDEGQQEVTQSAIINKGSFNKKSLKNIKVRVKSLAAWLAANSVPMTTHTVEPCPEDRFKQVRQLVGIHKLKAELISKMSSSSSQGLKIVSIWGTGGMGKTTLARAVYENIQGNFQYTAFVSVGPQPDGTKKALRDILIHLDKQKYSDLDITILGAALQLTNELRHSLENKRFLIVIDDIRNIESWEAIKLALVDNGCGSRIIITSRVLDVVESSGEVLKLMPLSIDGSKELFYATLFSHKGTIYFDQLVELSTEYILQKCGGVPLAIIMIASLLAGKPHKEWIKICHSIGFGHGDNNISADENTRKIIQFCYYGLPSHLRTCLLYLSIFPEDHVIEKDTLVWRWIAEGFGLVWIAPWQADPGPRHPKWELLRRHASGLLGINPNRPFVHDDREQEESLFKVGERYFYELVRRSMIQAIENEGSNIRACRVEGMVLEWIRFVAQEQDSVNIASGNWYDHGQPLFFGQNKKARIMAVHSGVLDNPYGRAGMWKQKMRSFNVIGCSSIMGTAGLRPFFQVLRVLSIEGCKLMSLYDGLQYLIEGLLHLRYLGLRGTHIRELPEKIDGLRYLQTLDLTGTYIRELPSSVTQLRQLKCLRCFVYKLQLPQGMGNLTSLEELQLGGVNKSPNFAKELSKLTELRVLHIFNSNRESSDSKWMELVKSVSKLQKIEELELFCDELSSDITCRHVIAPGGFPRMRHFRTNIWLMYPPGAMPCLKSIEFEIRVRDFNDANFDLHDFYKLSYLRLLEKVSIAIICREAKMEEVEESEAALRRVLESHPNYPKLILRRIGQCVDDEQVQCEDDEQIRFLGGLLGSEAAPQVMPLELLRQITNNFSQKQRLGSGTFGSVYKGVLEGKEIAVKLLHSLSQRLDYEEDFMKEFENLRRLDHPNIVQLLGYCYEIKRVCVKHEKNYVLADKIDRALCFDYMHNGSLQQHLHDESCGLDWQTRYKIIQGTCEGLKYLHKGLENPMLHLDLKPGNILLDKNMVPKLADFGLSKLVCDNQTQATSSFLGTRRYCPPEHFEGFLFSNKFDIFSLGVVMIEIIAGSEGYDKIADEISGEARPNLSGVGPCTNLSQKHGENLTPSSEIQNFVGASAPATIHVASPLDENLTLSSEIQNFVGASAPATIHGEMPSHSGGERLPPGDLQKEKEEPPPKFIDRVQENWRKRIHQATSGCISPKCECYQVERCTKTALQCVHRERMQRPNIEDIISRLNETENNTGKSTTTSSSRNEA